MNDLSFEVWILGWAGLLWAAQLVLAAVPANFQLGPSYLASARDEKRALSGVTARLERAYNNHIEGLLLFAVAVVVVVLSGASTPFTEGCAMAYLAARVAYVPLYGFGVPYLRTVAWSVGFIASLMMLGSVLI